MHKFQLNKPIFIIGNPRSGTSLLRLMLTCHENIIIPPESHFFLWLEKKYSHYDFSNHIDPFLHDLYDATKFETWQIKKKDLKDYLENSNIKTFTEAIANIYLYYGIIHDKNDIIYWGDKNKLWKEKLPKIKYYFPNAKFIHIVRDGRDVACSYKELDKKKSLSVYAPKLPTAIDEIALKWSLNVETIISFFKDHQNLSLHTVRYEDLLTKTNLVLNKICRYLELPFDSNMKNYLKLNEKEKYEPVAFLAWKEKLMSEPDISNIGKFKTRLSASELRIFEEVASESLKRFNYE